MRLRFQPWQLAAGLVLICLAAVMTAYFLRARGGDRPSAMLSYLHTSNAVVAFIDVQAMRRSGILDMIAGSKPAEELEYQQFVEQTLFDYRQDLDAAALAFRGGQVFFVLRGRFHWSNLLDYASRQGGTCHDSYCSMQGSQARRMISFYPIKGNLMALAVGPDDEAAYQIAPKPGSPVFPAPNQPIWILVPSTVLQNAEALPAAMKPYASALQNANQIVFSIGPQQDHLELFLQVGCKDASSASTLLIDLERATNSLRKMTDRQPQDSDSSMAGVLKAGSFSRQDRRVSGEWPIPRSFINSITAE